MQIINSVGAFTGEATRVFIAVPTIGPLCSETASSLFSTKELLLKNDVSSDLVICAYGCHVDDQRNLLVREFLNSKCDTFVFIDSDVQFAAEDFLSLVFADRDVVAGIYPYKQDVLDFPVRFLPGEIWSDEDGLVEVWGVPTGFLKIKRHVFEKLYEVVPKYKSSDSVNNIPLIFERVMDGNSRYGGDYEFCRKWRKLGGKIYIDPEMHLAHIGSKSYLGTLGIHLKRKSGLIDDYIDGFCKKMVDRTIDVADFGKLSEAWDNGVAVPLTEMLVILHDLAHDGTGPILEAGTGLSSLVFGSSGRPVTSLENNQDWADKIQTVLDRCGFNNVDIRCNDLKDLWYDCELSDDYSLILIDGPARLEGDRRKILTKLTKLKKDCVIVIDDVETREMTDAFTQRFGIDFSFYGRFAIGQYKGE